MVQIGGFDSRVDCRKGAVATGEMEEDMETEGVGELSIVEELDDENKGESS